MSSGGKKQTVGYWYRLLQAFGLCKGPIDALLEFRAGGRVAWREVVTESSRITVNAPNLWGGQKKEGGLLGQMDIQLGDGDQVANDYLQSRLGADQPTYRGKAMAVWRGGRWGAMNPYPKRSEFKLRRILKGWDDDVCWYPEKAAIEMAGGDVQLEGPGWEYQVETFVEPNTEWDNFVVPASGWLQGGELPFGTNGMAGGEYWTPTRSNIWLRRSITVRTSGISMNIAADNGCVVWVNGLNVGSSNPTNEPIAANDNNPVSYDFGAIGTVEVVVKAFAEISASNEAGNVVTLSFSALPLIAMNPAHILYDSLTARDMQREPIALVNDASFRAAADVLYDEGLGLCTAYEDEDIDKFQERILNVIGAGLSQSRENGQYYLDLIRPTPDLSGVVIITSDDIVELTVEPSTLTEMVNQISVKWFDPERNESRITQPFQNLGAIQAAGRVIPEQSSYPEVPYEPLALRLAARDAQARGTPLSKLSLTTNRRGDIWKLRTGQKFRLQVPEDGISDMLCVVGDIDVGTLKDGRIKIKAVQDVYSMPATVYVAPEPGQAPPIDPPPVASPNQRVIEAPYVELAANLAPADLEFFAEDAGVIMTMATQPPAGLNYALYSAPEGLELADNSTGEWCPSALVVEEASYRDRTFTLTGATDLARVELGTWALWDDEIVRVDALDPVALTVELGRGCADTPPTGHDAGSRIWFCGDWSATDDIEYVDGDTVTARLPTRTSSSELSLLATPELTIEMAQRQFRPYPPAGLMINGELYPDAISATLGDPGAVSVEWVWRDRLMQADKLFDTDASSIGPEPGTTCTVQIYDAVSNALLEEQTGLTAPPAEFTLAGSTAAALRVVAFSVRDALASYQPHDLVVIVANTEVVELMVVNPRAEFDISGWTVTTGNLQRRVGSSPVNTNFLFRSSSLYAHQDLAVPSWLAGRVDAGKILATLEWLFGGFTDPDSGESGLTFLDGSGSALGTTWSGLESLDTTNPMLPRQIVVEVPAGTRAVRVRMHGVRSLGTDGNAHWTDFKLSLTKLDFDGATSLKAESGEQLLTESGEPMIMES